MNQEIKEKWIKALRGQGDKVYTQVNGALHTTDGYCCLGVLCDISGLAEWGTSNTHGLFGYQGECGTLPEQIVKWAELPDYNPCLSIVARKNYSTCLTDLNDSGLTFSQIADMIEHFL